MYQRYPSPLRYPGGKRFLESLLREIIRLNRLEGGVYAEPFAGGAGVALALLFSEAVSEVYINDKDSSIYSFWRAVLDHTDAFLKMVQDAPVSVQEWRRQKHVLRSPRRYSLLRVGFATFYLNRCNHSGVLNAGPIGGLDQCGDYKIDVRFNKTALRKRIEKIALYKDRIHVQNLDGVAFLRTTLSKPTIEVKGCLAYMDPPYFEKAKRLYACYFSQEDHKRLADHLCREARYRWIISYDDVGSIRKLYSGRKRTVFPRYCLHSSKLGRELVIASPNCTIPPNWRPKPVVLTGCPGG